MLVAHTLRPAPAGVGSGVIIHSGNKNKSLGNPEGAPYSEQVLCGEVKVGRSGR